MTGIDKQRIIRAKAIARLARFIEKHLYNTNWTLVAQECGVIHILDKPDHERVRRAQGFGDSDYPDAIVGFLNDVFSEDEKIGLLLVYELALQENPHDEPLSPDARNDLEQIMALFGGQGIDIQSLVRKLQPVEDYISVTWIPDDFYKRLVNEINDLYREQLPFALSVLMRKLLENLIIDILRRKYGTAGLTLYYDTSKRRFHDFAVLIRNFDTKKTEFHYITPNLDKAIKPIEDYRETGNSGAHSLDVNLTIEVFTQDKQRINYLVQLLFRILQNIEN